MISGYYYYDRANQLKPFGDNRVPGFPTANGGRIQQINLSTTKAFGGSAVNEIRLNLLRYVNRSYQPTQGLGIKLSTYGFKEGVPGGFIPADPASEGVPQMSIRGGPHPLGQLAQAERLVRTRFEDLEDLVVSRKWTHVERALYQGMALAVPYLRTDNSASSADLRF